MGAIQVRPTGDVAVTNVKVDATAWQSLSDNLDSTTVNFYYDGPGSVTTELGDPAIPAGRYVWRTRAGIKIGMGAGGRSDTYLIQTNPAGQTGRVDYFDLTGSAQTVFGGWSYTAPEGGAFTTANINSMRLHIADNDRWGAHGPPSYPGPFIYEAYFEYEYTELAPAPTGVKPAAGSTVTTDLPTLQATIAPHVQGLKMYFEWQMATDAGFTANVRTVTQPSSWAHASGATSYPTPLGSALFQGLWYIRCRVIDQLGTLGPWSGATTFTVSHPPSARSLSPANGVIQGVSEHTPVMYFGWEFFDTSSIDAQTAYQIQVERNETGAVEWDSGKVVSTSATASWIYPNAEVVYRWRIKLWDRDNVEGAWSSYQVFTPGLPPQVTNVSPAANAVVTVPNPTVSWDYSSPGGRPQSSFQIQIHKAGVIIYDSGWVVSTTPSFTLPAGTLSNATSYALWVYVKDSANIQDTVWHGFTTQWIPPAAVLFTVNTTTYSLSGYNLLQWSTDNQDVSFQHYRVSRRAAGTTAWTILDDNVKRTTPGPYEYKDWTAPSGVSHEYAVIQVADRFGSSLESAYVPSTPVAPITEDYWLIHPDSTEYGNTADSKNFRFQYTNSDEFSEEYEEAIIPLIGRGRRVEYGTRFGYVGSISANVYSSPTQTARQQRLALEAIKASRSDLYLKNPFGDIWQVAAGNIQISRIAGVGQNEYHTVTIPYTEVS